MSGMSPKRRNSDIMSPDVDESSARKDANSDSAAHSRLLETPFKQDSENDFAGQRRDQSQLTASTSDAAGMQYDSTER